MGTPMVTFYKVTPLSWLAGKLLVRVPFYSMVNLIAGRAVVPELMQGQMTGEAIAGEARRLLTDDAARQEMKAGLAEVRNKLSGGAGIQAAPRRAAAIIQDILEGQVEPCFVISRPCCRSQPLLAVAAVLQAQDRRSRIDVEQYTIDAEVSPNTQSVSAKAAVRFTPLDDNITSASFELNNALNVSKVDDDKGKQIPASRNQQDFTVRLSFDQPLPKGQPVTITFYYDGKLTGQEDSPVYGIKFAAIHPDYSYPDVSGALVPGERLHHRPFRRRPERDGADGLYGAGQRHRFASRPPATRTCTSSSSSGRRFPAASRW